MNLKILNEKIDSLNNQLRNLKIKKSSFQSSINQAERKKRARNLIILGANFEILGYEKEETAVILGFLKENISLIDKKREYYKAIGNKILEERKLEKEKIKKDETSTKKGARQINDDEIKELLLLSKEYDFSTFIKNNFHKTLWETLTVTEFELIKNSFKEKKEASIL